ncbi:hypothetical protein DL240_11195 [Lujinxingia litoralis]|uniref:Uncharacterized protein n=1 Tax=Lujinxingia litoralis TaxID=2211119 RepID=A0A328C5Y1_9DELT|nr:hypothetical protein [Lujinxingia litoralis]RAL22406.1 hypothetical protein DL240_11195 [Lujinxingia litoralis]
MAQRFVCNATLKPFDHARALERLEALYHARAELPHASLAALRETLVRAADCTCAQVEHALIALARHPDPAADALLHHPRLRFDEPRRAFALHIARRVRARRRQRSSDHRPGRRAA